MEFKNTEIEGLIIAESNRIGDERGSFMRLFCNDSIEGKTKIDRKVKQINFSHTEQIGTVRGMHFQKCPALESKIVRCIEGKILDIAVDLREGSNTFLKYAAVELSAENNLALIIPEGFAHGFQVLEKNSKMIYLHSENYTPEYEGGIRFDEPNIGIDWPLEPVNLSERDLNFPFLNNDFKGLEIKG